MRLSGLKLLGLVLLLYSSVAASVQAINWSTVDDKTDYFSVDRTDPDQAKWELNPWSTVPFVEECNNTGCHSVWVQGGTMNTRQDGLSGCGHTTQICPDATVVTKAAWSDSLRATTRIRIQKVDPNANLIDAEFNYRLLSDGASIWSPAVDLYSNIHWTLFGLQRSFRLSTDGVQVASWEDYGYNLNEWFQIGVVVDRGLGLTTVRVLAETSGICLIDRSGSSSLSSGNHQVRAGYLFRHNIVTYTDYHIAEQPGSGGGPGGVSCGTGGGGGGGSVAKGTLITKPGGSRAPVQNLRAGDQILLFDVYTETALPATISSIRQVSIDNMLTIHTENGLPLRVDTNPRLKFYVWMSTGPVLKPVTEFQPGDLIYNYDYDDWVSITQVHVSYGGSHEYYDLLTDPYLNADGQYLSFIANGYADPCTPFCKLGPTP